MIAETELEVLSERSMREQSQTSNQDIFTPVIQSALKLMAYYYAVMNTIYYLNKSSDPLAVAAYGLGFTWAKLVGFGVLNGVRHKNIQIASGVETLVAQAYGANEVKQCASIYFRGLTVATLLMVPISILMLYSSNIMIIINNNHELMQVMQVYTTYSLLTVYVNGLYAISSSYLNGQKIYIYQTIAQVTSTCVNCLINYILCNYYEFGVKEACLSRLTGECISLSLVILFMNRPKWNLQLDFIKLWQFFKMIVPIGSLLWFDWACFNLFIIQSSFLETTEQNLFVIITNMTGFLCAMPAAIMIGSSIQVGNSMGSKNSILAKQQTIYALKILCTQLTTTIIVVCYFRNWIGSLITRNQLETELFSSRIILVCGILITDGSSMVLAGIQRGVGNERYACVTFLISYLAIGQPLSIFFAFILDLQLNGILIAMITAIGFFCGLQLRALYLLNWEFMIKGIHEKLLIK